jgi:hypothetical protein
LDLAALGARRQHHPANLRADRFASLPAGFGIGERFHKACDPYAIDLHDPRMHGRQRFGRLGKPGLELDPLPLKFGKAVAVACTKPSRMVILSRFNPNLA